MFISMFDVRESLERALKSDGAGMLDDPFLTDNAVYEGDSEVDLAQNHDIYLYEKGIHL